nr:MAG TPA: hypothetical protein [Caudoviricetes sp.]
MAGRESLSRTRKQPGPEKAGPCDSGEADR